MGICCMAQETKTGALYQSRGVGWCGRWEGGSKGKAYIYTYGWFILRFDRKQQNSVKQLSFNKKNKKKKSASRSIFSSFKIFAHVFQINSEIILDWAQRLTKRTHVIKKKKNTERDVSQDNDFKLFSKNERWFGG